MDGDRVAACKPKGSEASSGVCNIGNKTLLNLEVDPGYVIYTSICLLSKYFYGPSPVPIFHRRSRLMGEVSRSRSARGVCVLPPPPETTIEELNLENRF